VLNPFIANGGLGQKAFGRYIITLTLVLSTAFGSQLWLLLFVITGMMLNGVQFTNPITLDVFPPLLFFVLAMVPLGLGLAALLVGVRLYHARPVRSLITAAPAIRWNRLLASAGLYTLLLAVNDVIGYVIDPGSYTFQFNAGTWLPLLLLALLLVPFQIGAEEALFRGYLMQGIGWLTRRPWVALLITSVLFGLGHLGNPEPATYGVGIMMANYIGMGLFLGILTLVDHGLELALGVHLANNLYGALIITFPGSALELPALFRAGGFDPYLSLLVFAVMSLIYAAIMLGPELLRRHRAGT
jgi:uncharacterized protein